MRNKKALILLGGLIFSPIIASTQAATMVDPLGADCHTGFITGCLWSGRPVPRDEVVYTFQDIGEPEKGKISTSVLSVNFGSSVDDILENVGHFLEAVSVSRDEEESYRENIRSFLGVLREVAVSQATKPEVVDRTLSIIFSKYAE